MKSIPYGFTVEAYEPIDNRLILTKEQMKTAHEDMSLPDNYFAFCIDDNSWYEYSYAREEAGDLDPETGYYRLVPSGLVNDVLVNGVSVVEDKIAKVEVIDDVKVDGSSVVEDGVANIDLSDKQDKLTAGDKIKIENNVISVEGIKQLQEGYGIIVTSEGSIAIDTEVVMEKSEMPENVSELYNDAGYITDAVLTLENYYLKEFTYNKDEVNSLLASLGSGLKLEVVAVLPVTGDDKTIYLVRRTIDSNIYDQWVYQPSNPTPWIQVGSTEVNLDNYYTKAEVNNLLSQKADTIVSGVGISVVGNYVSVDMGTSMTATGNKLDVKQATPYQKGVVSYDDATIKMNANGQLYSVGGGGGGSYVAGPNIQINGNVISATDTTYRAGDGIRISGDVISASTDDETIKVNRRGELYMDAVAINTGEGINITRDGTIEIVPSEVAEALDLSDYQEKLIAGDNIQINGRVISSTGGGSGSANWGSIGGTLSNQVDLMGALNGKQKQLVAGSNITLTDLGSQMRISATGGSGGASSFADLSGSPYDNVPLKNALNSKQDVIDPSNKLPASSISGLAPVALSGNYNDLSNRPTIGSGTLTIQQNGSTVGTFNANADADKVINLSTSTVNPGNGRLTIQQNGTTIKTFTANQTSDDTVNIVTPKFEFDASTGVLRITNR